MLAQAIEGYSSLLRLTPMSFAMPTSSGIMIAAVAVALVMALDRAMKNLNGGDSIYNHRGFIVL